MLQNFIESGAYNSTFWFVLAVLLALALRWRPAEHRLAFGVVVLLLFLGTAANLFLSLYKGYAVPRDAMQDIVSAQEYLAGRPLYPDDMTQRINDALARDGRRRSLLEPWPALRERERVKIDEMLKSHWVQAHPPFMTLFTAPFVQLFGILGTQIAFLLIAATGLALTLFLIRIELFPHAPGWAVAVAATAIVGWDPLLTVLRGGQTGLMLGGLLTASWFWLRRGRPVWSGIAVGIAVSVKLVPGLILLVLVMRHRRAFATALATIAVIGLFVFEMTSIQDQLDYVGTSREVVNAYGVHSGNVSLFAAVARGQRHLLQLVAGDTHASKLDDLTRSLQDHGMMIPDARLCWIICGGAIVLAFAWRMRRPPVGRDEKTDVDLQFATALALMPLLSPISWDHYLVYLILPFSVLASRITAESLPGAAGSGPADSKPVTHRKWLVFTALVLLFAAPDSAFHWIYDLCRDADLRGMGVWLVLDLRAGGLIFLVAWLFREMRRLSRLAPPQAVAPDDSLFTTRHERALVAPEVERT